MADEEEVVEGEEYVEEGGGAEFVPERSTQAKPDVFTFILACAFVVFLVGIVMAAKELYQHYDVQFWILSKK